MNNSLSRIDHDYTPIASDCNIPTIASLHHYHDCLFTFKTVHNYILCKPLTVSFNVRQITYNLRDFRVLNENTQHTNLGFYSSINKMKRSWNLLPSAIRNEVSISCFKARLRSLTTIF